MKFGSVCSGIEAASVAWESLGFEAQWFSEIEHFPSEVLKYRYPTVPNLGDMTKLTQNETFRASSINLLVGGTPCQSFSVAGLRGGLADPRGNLMLNFLSLADAKKPRWIVWENVPGVLSSNGGKDFDTFLGALGELGYGFAYRVLDAQHFGVAQRRRRVFVIGYLGDWRPAAAVLFERESLQRDSKPSRKKGQETPTDAEGGPRTTSPDGRETIGTLRQRDYKGIGNDDLESGRGLAIEVKQVAQPISFNERQQAQTVTENCANTLSATDYKGVQCVAQPIMLDDQGGSVMRVIEDGVCGTLRRETHGHEPLVAQPQYFESHPNDSRVTGPHDVGNTVSARYGTGGGNTPLVSQPISWDSEVNCNINKMGTLVRGGQGGRTDGVAQPIAVDWRTAQVDVEMTGTLKTDLAKMSGPCIAVDVYNQSINEKTSQTVLSQKNPTNIGAVLEPTIIDRAAFNQEPHAVAGFLPTQGSKAQGIGYAEEQSPTLRAGCDNYGVMHTMAIRRLTPKECERLQGFPDDWTKIPYRNKPADQCPDGPRYKACGNSMAVPVMRWIGQRIQLIDTILNK